MAAESHDHSAEQRQAHITGADALSWAAASGSADEVTRRLAARQRARHRRRAVALASGAAMLLMAMAAWWWRSPVAVESLAISNNRPSLVSLSERQVLPDGSVVEIKRGARIEVQFTPEFRRVVQASGEAHFQVIKDPSRPFVVVANGVEVRAVGTAFDILIGLHTVDVLVTEGKVAVDRASAGNDSTSMNLPGPSAAPLLFLGAGYRTAVDTTASPQPPVATVVAAAERDQRLAWRLPRLEFSTTPLTEVVAMFNKYGRTTLVLDPGLGSVKVSGVLRIDDVESLLMLLQNEFSIGAERRGEETVLRRR